VRLFNIAQASDGLRFGFGPRSAGSSMLAKMAMIAMTTAIQSGEPRDLSMGKKVFMSAERGVDHGLPDGVHGAMMN